MKKLIILSSLLLTSLTINTANAGGVSVSGSNFVGSDGSNSSDYAEITIPNGGTAYAEIEWQYYCAGMAAIYNQHTGPIVELFSDNYSAGDLTDSGSAAAGTYTLIVDSSCYDNGYGWINMYASLSW